MKKPDIALIYQDHLSSDLFNEFKEAFSDDELEFVIESEPDHGPYACPEWFITTAVVVFLSRSYFDGFLKEAGKDHYQALKGRLSNLTNKVMSKPKIEPVLMGTEGKLSSNNPYSLAFSIYAEANDGNSFKLMLPKPYDTDDYTEIIYKFLEFLNNYHSGISSIECDEIRKSAIPQSKLIFVHMNNETKQIEWLDQREYR